MPAEEQGAPVPLLLQRARGKGQSLGQPARTEGHLFLAEYLVIGEQSLSLMPVAMRPQQEPAWSKLRLDAC